MTMETRSKYLMTFATLALMVILASCAAPAAVDIDCDTFANTPHQTDRIEVQAGDAFTIRLCSNPTTGYGWTEDADISDADVIQLSRQEFTAPSDDAPLVGAPGTHSWTFTALQAGESTITLEYSQPWDGGDKGAWTFTLTVIVQ
jgi:inhibitor of cysteine peptidase